MNSYLATTACASLSALVLPEYHVSTLEPDKKTDNPLTNHRV